MKILVAGSRSIDPHVGMHIVMPLVFLLVPDTETISWVTGCCSSGADGIPFLIREHSPGHSQDVIHEFPADWDKYKKSAGPIRNALMAEFCDAAVILWDGRSKGTSNIVDNLKNYMKPTIVYMNPGF